MRKTTGVCVNCMLEKNTHTHTHTHAGVKHILPTSWLSSTIECVVWCYRLFRSRLKSAETWADGQVKALVWLTTGAARTPGSGEGSLPRCSARKTSCEVCGWKPIRSFRLSGAEPEERGKREEGRRREGKQKLQNCIFFFFFFGGVRSFPGGTEESPSSMRLESLHFKDV